MSHFQAEIPFKRIFLLNACKNYLQRRVCNPRALLSIHSQLQNIIDNHISDTLC
jgi:hypothetical protein